MNPYESPRLLAEYLLLHYGSADDVLDARPGPADAVGFPVRLVRELLALPAGGRALDLGCAVGASSFELSRHFEHVLGIDFSRTFVEAATRLRDEGRHPFEKVIEGTIREPAIARVPADIDLSRTRFQQGDAENLPPDLADLDLVLAANLLCRLSNPRRLLDRLPSLVKPGGQLLLTTPFTWLEEFTPRENWIGATPESGHSIDALKQLLEPAFELEHVTDLPFLIREHSRKFQYGIACGTRWRRK